MAEHAPSGDAKAPDVFHPEAREQFRTALTAEGFLLVDDDGKGKERWDGVVATRWTDASTNLDQAADHRVRIVMWPGFPFQQPSAYLMDSSEAIPRSRHATPLPNGSLCLYAASYRPDTQRGWAPWRTGQEFLERLRELLGRIHSGEWDDADRPPDLHLAFPRGDADSTMTLVGRGWAPPSGEHTGRFGVWRKSEVVMVADSPVAGVAAVSDSPAKEIALMVLGVRDAPRAGVGAWFRLDREPQPRQTLGGLFAEIDRATAHTRGWAHAECKRLIGGDSGGNRPLFVALGYPEKLSPGSESWLFVLAEPESLGKTIRWREPESITRAVLRASETVPVDPFALMRRNGPLAKAVAGRTVLIFGVGALGGAVALLLARSGIERLLLVDSDRLRPGNAVRHVGGLAHTGKPKTEALWWEILTHVPEADVEKFDSTWNPEHLDILVRAADVVVDATAEQPFNLLLNEVCVRANRTLVQAETTRRAAIGRVRVVRPRRDACLLCYSAHAKTNAYPVVPPGDEGEFFEAGCGVPTVEAPAVDVEATANWTARTVLWVLRDTLGPRNHLLVVNDEVPGLTGEAALVGAHWAVFAPIPECSACGAPPPGSVEANESSSTA
ncbi:MAG TPA: ThiF family adenylyltransferase [Gemmatimonadaceae bacterium]